MALSKQDRIELSAKLAGIADEKKAADESLVSLDKGLAKATAKDEPNKKLLDQRTALINPYQNELKLLDGIIRTELIESILTDSVNRVIGNSFFPNKQVAMPSIPDGIWKKFVPFSGTHAIGKNNLEAYTSTSERHELTVINEINAKIVTIETKSIANRASGKIVVVPPPPVPPALPTPSYLASDPIIQGLLTDLKTLVQEWENFLNNEKIIILSVTDSNSTRTSQNSLATGNINTTISAIDTWQAVQDFDTTTVPPVIGFDSLPESYFQQAKLQPTTLQALKNSITSRTSYRTTRISQLSGANYLGSITQDLSSGNITATTGLYGERMLFIDMRINAVSGTLTEIVSFSGAKTAQEQSKQASNIAAQGAALAMKATKAVAPGIDTKYLNFESLSGFSVGDRVYLVADDQEELSGSIEEISNNRAKLTFSIPKKYTPVNNTRLYKLL